MDDVSTKSFVVGRLIEIIAEIIMNVIPIVCLYLMTIVTEKTLTILIAITSIIFFLSILSLLEGILARDNEL